MKACTVYILQNKYNFTSYPKKFHVHYYLSISIEQDNIFSNILHIKKYYFLHFFTSFKNWWKLSLYISLGTNIILHHIQKHFIFIIIYQSQSIKTICFQIYFIYTIKCGWLGPIFGIFHDLLTQSNHWTTWQPEDMTLCPHTLD